MLTSSSTILSVCLRLSSALRCASFSICCARFSSRSRSWIVKRSFALHVIYLLGNEGISISEETMDRFYSCHRSIR